MDHASLGRARQPVLRSPPSSSSATGGFLGRKNSTPLPPVPVILEQTAHLPCSGGLERAGVGKPSDILLSLGANFFVADDVKTIGPMAWTDSVSPREDRCGPGWRSTALTGDVARELRPLKR